MSELIRNFGIDWKLLLAQAVNFFILLIILKKFAYGPVLRMLKKRKEEIEKGLRFSKEAEEKFKRIGGEREEIIKEARGEALAIVNQAEETALGRQEEIVAEASKKSEIIFEEAKRVIEQEKAKMGEEIYKGAEDLIRAGLIRVLGKLPPETKDQSLVQEALQELKTIK